MSNDANNHDSSKNSAINQEQQREALCEAPRDSQTQPILRDIPCELTGARIVLKVYVPGDGAALWEAISDDREHLVRWQSWAGNLRTPADAEAYVRRKISRWMLRDDLAYAIRACDTNRYLGNAELEVVNWEECTFGIGYWLRRSAEGHGYMSEAVRLLCALAFENLGAARVHIKCDVLNMRSANVARRLGFLQEALLHNERRNTAGDLQDTLVFALTPEDYARVREEWGN